MRIKIPLIKLSPPLAILVILLGVGYAWMNQSLTRSEPWKSLHLSELNISLEYPSNWSVAINPNATQLQEVHEAVIAYESPFSPADMQIHGKIVMHPTLAMAEEYGNDKLLSNPNFNILETNEIIVGESIPAISYTYRHYGATIRDIYFVTDRAVIILKLSGGSRSYLRYDDEFSKMLASIFIVEDR